MGQHYNHQTSSSIWKSELTKRNIEIESDTILIRCISYCETYNLDIETFLNKFEAWALSHLKYEASLSLDSNSISEFLSSEISQVKENNFLPMMSNKNTTINNNISSTFKASSPQVPRTKPFSIGSPIKEVDRKSNITDLLVWPSNNDVSSISKNIMENTNVPEISLLFETNLPDKYMRIIWPKVAKRKR